MRVARVARVERVARVDPLYETRRGSLLSVMVDFLSNAIFR